MKKKYIIKSDDRTLEELEKIEEIKSELQDSFKLSDITIDLLFNRGFDTKEKIINFLNADLGSLHSGVDLPDSNKFLDAILDIMENDEEITIESDFDVDGCCSAAVFVLACSNLQIKVNYHSNNRFLQGYGLSVASVHDIFNKFPKTKLIVTADNGIVAFEGIKEAYKLGIKVVVTDHHKVGEELPAALAVVNTKREDSNYPFSDLCGAGVIFKLMHYVYSVLNADMNYLYSLLDIVALATVVDKVSMIDENRIIVKQGLKLHNNKTRKAFEMLKDKIGIQDVTEDILAFKYGPCFNALSKITGCIDEAVEFLITNDTNRLNEICQKIIDLNEKRKEITEKQKQLAVAKIEAYKSEFGEIQEVIVLRDDNFSQGVIGDIATQLRDEYHKPIILLSPHTTHTEKNGILIEENVWKGCARSIHGFDIKENLQECKDILKGFGGFPMSAGLTVTDSNFKKFTQEINSIAKRKITKDIKIRSISIDSKINLSDLNFNLIDDIEKLRPFGMGFSRVIFCLTVENIKSTFLGSNMQHLKIISEDKEIICFNKSDKYNLMGRPSKVCVIGIPVINSFNNNEIVNFQGVYLEKDI